MNEKNKYDEAAREQIEQMVKIIDQAKHDMWVGECPTYAEHSENIAKYLYNAGYLKQSEGEWILEEAWDVRSVDSYRCSMCGYSKRVDEAESFVYCPNCGAKMKGVAHEE